METLHIFVALLDFLALHIHLIFCLGFSVNHGVVQRWTLDASYQARVRELIDDMTFYKNTVNVHHNLSPKRIQRDEENVKAIVNIINENFISPFEKKELVSLSNGVLPTEKITSDLLTAKEKGLPALNTFIAERLMKQTKQTFTNQSKS